MLGDPVNLVDVLGLKVDLILFKKGTPFYYRALLLPSFYFNGYTIGAHGAADATPMNMSGEGEIDIEPNELHELMLKHGYKEGEVVSLLSCELGAGKEPYAQRLANELGVTVYAPTGNFQYGIFTYGTSDKKGLKPFKPILK